MASELLEKEAQFHKLNKELEIRTQALLQEVESVMKIQEYVQSNSDATIPTISVCAQMKNDFNAFDSNCEDDSDILPEASKHMGTQGFTRFLKAKIRKLQSEIVSIQADYKKKCNSIKSIQADHKTVEDERNKYLQQLNTQKELVCKQEEQISVLSSRLQTKETENNCLRKEVDALKKEIKTFTASSSSHELRLNKALEDVDKYKLIIKQMKQDDKEFRDSNQKKIQEMSSSIKRLEKLKSDLNNAFKKQTLLIDNLRRQKIQLEASRMLQISEEEFIKILDWNIPEKKLH